MGSPTANSASNPTSSSSSLTQYHDNWLDRLFLRVFSRKMAQALGQGLPPQAGYPGFVELSHQIVQGRSPDQQQQLVARILASLVPWPVRWASRSLFTPNQWVCEANAWFAQQFFEWLVGPCDLKTVEVLDHQSQQPRQQTSAVQIRKCRYLEQSGCVGMCVNMCKVPTQTFFTEQFGIPLTMVPNFEDLSCEMIFGQHPPDPAEDPAHQQPCLSLPSLTQAIVPCPTANPRATACPKLAS